MITKVGRSRIRCGDDTAITNHDVVATERINQVAEATADEDVVSFTRIDVVHSAKARGRKTFNQVNVGSELVRTRDTRLAFAAGVFNDPIIAEHDVITFVDVDEVTFMSAQNDVVAIGGSASVDRIHSTVAKGNRLHSSNREREVAELGSFINGCGD